MKKIIVFLIMLTLIVGTSLAEELRTVIRVVDGDTIVLDGKERVRLIGVDTPETVHPSKPVEYYGKEASSFTKSLWGIPGNSGDCPRIELRCVPKNEHRSVPIDFTQ